MCWYKTIVIVILLIVSVEAHADTTRVGVGAIIDSSAGFLLPIVNDDWIIEPSISAKKNKTDTISLTDAARSKRSSRTVTLGAGFFKKRHMMNNTFAYYGARVGFILRKTKEEREASAVLPAISSKSDETGYFFAPTMGVQYFFIPQLSVGIDLTFQLTKTSGDEKETSNGTTIEADAENISYATSAEVIIRYLF